MKTIRQNVFETNSSSSHSVTIVGNCRENFSNEFMKIERGEFWWEYQKHDDFFTKLSFAYTLATPLKWSSRDGEGSINPTSTREMWMLDNFLKNYLGVKKVIYSDKEGSIDHESHWLKEVIFRDDDTLADFLLGENSFLQLDFNNRETYYDERYRGTRDCTVHGETIQKNYEYSSK